MHHVVSDYLEHFSGLIRNSDVVGKEGVIIPGFLQKEFCHLLKLLFFFRSSVDPSESAESYCQQSLNSFQLFLELFSCIGLSARRR